MSCKNCSSAEPTPILPAKMYDADFPDAHGNFETLDLASDGNLYYILATHVLEAPGQMYRLNPKTEELTHIADLSEAMGEGDIKAIPQAKGHVNFYEHEGKLYSATHVGYYKRPEREDDFIELAAQADGYLPYPGGHFFSYDLSTGEFESLAKAPQNEGIVTMMMDKKRERLYGLTWPTGLFIYYDLPTKTFKNLGPAFGKGEAGDFEKGEWKLICRMFALDPRNGNLYWTRAKGEMFKYDYEKDRFGLFSECPFNNPEFGPLVDHSLWRHIFWYDKEQVFYGVHYKANYLFRFDPDKQKVEPLLLLAAEPYNDPATHTQECYLPFRIYHWYWGTLAFKLGPDGETIYYLASGPEPENKGDWEVSSTTRFITYHIPTGTYKDHGTLRLPDGRYPTDPQCIAMANGKVYSVEKVEILKDDHSPKAEKVRKHWAKKEKNYVEETNLFSFDDPHFK